jgi:hypothetical protein
MRCAPGRRARVERVLGVLRDPAFRQALDALPGDDASMAGAVCTLEQAFPALKSLRC